MADVVIKDRDGEDVTYTGVEKVTFNTPIEGETATFSYGNAVENEEIEPDFSAGDQNIYADDGELIKSAILKKPDTLTPENIRKNINVAGIVGEYVGDTEELTVDLNMTDGNQEITPSSEEKVMAKVTVTKPDTLIPENIVNGVNIGGVIGAHNDELNLYAAGANSRTWAVDKISRYMFFQNNTLTYESFPNASYVGSNAFGYASIISVDLPLCRYLSNYAFNSCIKLTSASLQTCRQLYGGAFQSCYSLKQVELPLCVSVGDAAFKSCSNLTSVLLPICSWVGAYAFQGCSKITEISLPVCSSIGSYAFSGCSLLSVLYAPSCTFLSAYPFSGCSNLCDITLGQSASLTSLMYLRYIASNKHLTIRGKPAIFSSAFQYCMMSGLSILGLQTIYPQAFTRCTNLKQVYNYANFIWTSQFSCCYSLRRVISPALTRIGQYALANCSSLQYFSGKYLSYISKFAFMSCKNLSVVMLTSYSKLGSVYTDAFNSTPIVDSTYLGYYGSIYVPESLLASYLGDANWATWSSRFAVITSEIEALFEWEDL